MRAFRIVEAALGFVTLQPRHLELPPASSDPGRGKACCGSSASSSPSCAVAAYARSGLTTPAHRICRDPIRRTASSLKSRCELSPKILPSNRRSTRRPADCHGRYCSRRAPLMLGPGEPTENVAIQLIQRGMNCPTPATSPAGARKSQAETPGCQKNLICRTRD
jgi:hypothetical protein